MSNLCLEKCLIQRNKLLMSYLELSMHKCLKQTKKSFLRLV